jgi:uncharacterized protein
MAPGGEEEAVAPLLAGRWRAFSRIAGRLVVLAVEHQPWPLRAAELVELDETMLAAAGVAGKGDPLVHHAAGVDARFDRPRRAGPFP